jgi:flavin reductase (DIM6/NTAB) family NADH-FMN oxidoreductase RutF
VTSQVLPPPPAAGLRRAEPDAVTGAAGLRRALRQHASGVTVITAGAGVPVGFCAASLATVSLDPAVVSFSVSVRSASWGTISTAELMLAHLLGAGQGDLARRFGRSGTAKFDPPTRWHRDDLGLPRLPGVRAWLVLAPIARLPVDDHMLVVGRVIRATAGDLARGPLIHHAGRYTSVVGPAR